MKNKRSSTAKMQIACAIIFITFTYVYLAFYQAEYWQWLSMFSQAV